MSQTGKIIAGNPETPTCLDNCHVRIPQVCVSILVNHQRDVTWFRQSLLIKYLDKYLSAYRVYFFKFSPQTSPLRF